MGTCHLILYINGPRPFSQKPRFFPVWCCVGASNSFQIMVFDLGRSNEEGYFSAEPGTQCWNLKSRYKLTTRSSINGEPALRPNRNLEWGFHRFRRFMQWYATSPVASHFFGYILHSWESMLNSRSCWVCRVCFRSLDPKLLVGMKSHISHLFSNLCRYQYRYRHFAYKYGGDCCSWVCSAMPTSKPKPETVELLKARRTWLDFKQTGEPLKYIVHTCARNFTPRSSPLSSSIKDSRL